MGKKKKEKKKGGRIKNEKNWPSNVILITSFFHFCFSPLLISKLEEGVNYSTQIDFQLVISRPEKN